MIRPLVAAALLVALGWPSVRRLRPAWGSGATAAAAAVVASTAVVSVGLPLALAGIPPAAALLAGAAAAAAFGLLPGGGESVRAVDPRPESPWLRGASALVLLASAGVFVAKMARAPLWSWDHYAIWGLKARRLLADGALDLGFLVGPEAAPARPDHPLGVPAAWLTLTFGRRPEGADFVLLHALTGVALLLVLRGAVRGVAGSWSWGNLLAAALASSPLYWDTVAVGLAEMPLALWATTGAAMLLAAADGPRTAAAGGLALGFLPWLKSEGFPLAVLLFAAVLWSSRSAFDAGRRRWGPAAVAFATALSGAWAIGRFVLPPGASFFLGDWASRGVERLPQVVEIAAFCLGELLAWDWLLFWPALALCTLAALALRHRVAGALAVAVWLQVSIYAATALFTYLGPIDHLRAAFFRITAALVAPGLLAIAPLLAPRGSFSPPGTSLFDALRRGGGVVKHLRRGFALAAGWIVVVDAALWWIYYHPAAKELYLDEWQYFWNSELVLLGRSPSPNLIWPPGQATLLAALRRGFGELAPAVLAMQLWHTALLVLAAVLLADVARRASGSAAAGAAAGLLWLAHPSMLAFSQYLFVEPLFMALLLVAVWLPVRFRERPRALPWAALGAGVAWGVSLLFKSALAHAWPLWFLLLRPPVGRRPLRRWLPAAALHLALFLLAGLAVTLPVRLDNWRLHGDPIVADTSVFSLWTGLHDEWRADAYLDATGLRLRAYLDSADNPAERRRIYREKVLDLVAERGVASVLRFKVARQPFRLLSSKTNLITQLPGPACRGHLPSYRQPQPALVALLVLGSHALHASTLVAFAFGLLLWPYWRRVETWGLLGLLAYFAAVFFVGHVESRYSFWTWPILCVFAGWFAVRLLARLTTGAPVAAGGRPAAWRWLTGSALAVLLLWFAFAGPHLDRMCT